MVYYVRAGPVTRLVDGSRTNLAPATTIRLEIPLAASESPLFGATSVYIYMSSTLGALGIVVALYTESVNPNV